MIIDPLSPRMWKERTHAVTHYTLGIRIDKNYFFFSLSLSLLDIKYCTESYILFPGSWLGDARWLPEGN